MSEMTDAALLAERDSKARHRAIVRKLKAARPSVQRARANEENQRRNAGFGMGSGPVYREPEHNPSEWLANQHIPESERQPAQPYPYPATYAESIAYLDAAAIERNRQFHPDMSSGRSYKRAMKLWDKIFASEHET